MKTDAGRNHERSRASANLTQRGGRRPPRSTVRAALAEVLILASGALSGSCTAEGSALPDASSEYVDLYLADNLHVCAGQLGSYDEFVSRVLELYAPETDATDLRVTVNAVADTAATPCGTSVSCALDGAAWVSQDLGQYHEIVHVIQGELDGRSNRALEEGTAEALGPLAPLAYVPRPPDSLSPEFLFGRELTGSDYGPAAAFARFLIDTWGTETYRDLFRRLDEVSGDEDSFREEFQFYYATDFDAAWNTFMDGPRCAYDFWYCDQTDSLELPILVNGLDCTSPDTLGFFMDGDPGSSDSAYRMERIVRFDLVDAAVVTFTLTNSMGYLGRCGACGEQMPVILLASQNGPDTPPIPIDLELLPGEYVLIFREGREGVPALAVETG